MSEDARSIDRPQLTTGCLLSQLDGTVIDAGRLLMVPGIGLYVNHGAGRTSHYPPGEVWVLSIPTPSPN